MFKKIKAFLWMRKAMQSDCLSISMKSLNMYMCSRYIKSLRNILQCEKTDKISKLFENINDDRITKMLIASEEIIDQDHCELWVYDISDFSMTKESRFFYLDDEEYDDLKVSDVLKPILNMKYNSRLFRIKSNTLLLDRKINSVKSLIIESFNTSLNSQKHLEIIAKEFSRACPVFTIRYFINQDSMIGAEISIWYGHKKSKNAPDRINALIYELASDRYKMLIDTMNRGGISNDL